ncbi:Murein DD-endopeptidase MepM [Calidithermus terrae]|uniref:Murein DD-endopeptidase MepM n=1 Tax=Calidithermus terrae TaxID=1408545 RepID=A0A399F347_9DEIN|nr:peptidoglycan DD-metalloendopeptidase family protein [Calidithermus terrae]RIH90205.1 Murein DD-endopeptidase MepM [Calidithermus terrae]
MEALLKAVVAGAALHSPLATLVQNDGTEVVLEPPANKGWVLYTVQSGDTLIGIAGRYRVDPKAIMYSSGLEGIKLKPGQQLRIPLTAGRSDREPRVPPGVEPYTVRSRDTLKGIAARFGVSELELITANPWIPSLDRLTEGAVLHIPTGQKGLLVRLSKGQTLLDLSGRFGVSLLKLAKVNGIDNPAEVAEGDLILIPGILARTTYDNLLAKREAERQARLEAERKAREEAARLAEQRRREEAARREAEAKRQARLAAQRQAQAQTQARRQAAQPATVRRSNFVSEGGYTYPVKSYVITTYFGRRGAYQRYHTGVDFAAPHGTPIYAARSGQVQVAGWSTWGYGYHVVIDHGGGVDTLYGHMSRFVVSAGEWVERGQLIGYVGSTGWSTGPHLHFEVRVGGSPRNPLAYLP